MPRISSKLPRVGTTIFSVMSQMAADHDAINLSQGYPDFHCPQELMDLVTQAINKGLNQYAPMTGILELREQVALKSMQLYQASPDPVSEITITSGATEAIFVAIQTTASPGSEVIVFDPAYDSYEPAINLAGAKAVHLALRAPEFKIDWQQVKDAITDRTSMIIINSPHNPTGAILDHSDLQWLSDLTRNSDILILSDEVYEHMVFDGNRHHSLLTHPELATRSFVISSFGKTYHATGWKVAYCIAPQNLSAEFRKIHQYVTFCTTTPFQYALAEYMNSNPGHYHELADFYQAKRDHFNLGLENSQFRIFPTQGTYFQLADYSNISTMDDVKFSAYLTQEVGVAAIPISVFCEHTQSTHMVRFCFAKNDSTLDQAVERLSNIRVTPS